MNPFWCISVFDNPEAGLLGNIAAVILLEKPLPEPEMQQLAADINQPATTFLWPGDDGSYHVRWFAPDEEIGLCGHGTLAAVAALQKKVTLRTSRDELTGEIHADNFASMNLSAIPVTGRPEPPAGLADALGVSVKGYFTTDNKHIVLLEDEETLVNMEPDFGALRKIDVFGYTVTAPGDTSDFVSRTLVPHVGQLEDHATGSSHAALTPFWADRLKKTQLMAIQRSPRGGQFSCLLDDSRVILKGHYTILVEGRLRK